MWRDLDLINVVSMEEQGIYLHQHRTEEIRRPGKDCRAGEVITESKWKASPVLVVCVIIVVVFEVTPRHPTTHAPTRLFIPMVLRSTIISNLLCILRNITVRQLLKRT